MAVSGSAPSRPFFCGRNKHRAIPIRCGFRDTQVDIQRSTVRSDLSLSYQSSFVFYPHYCMCSWPFVIAHPGNGQKTFTVWILGWTPLRFRTSASFLFAVWPWVWHSSLYRRDSPSETAALFFIGEWVMVLVNVAYDFKVATIFVGYEIPLVRASMVAHVHRFGAMRD